MYKKTLEAYQKKQKEALAERLSLIVKGEAQSPNVDIETHYVWAKSTKTGYISYDILKENEHALFLKGDALSKGIDTQFIESVTVYTDKDTKQPIAGYNLKL
jgi:hypothetical protein